MFPQFPAIQLLKDRISTLVKYSFKEDSSNHDGYSERGCPPEEKIVDRLSQRHVDGSVLTAQERMR